MRSAAVPPWSFQRCVLSGFSAGRCRSRSLEKSASVRVSHRESHNPRSVELRSLKNPCRVRICLGFPHLGGRSAGLRVIPARRLRHAMKGAGRGLYSPELTARRSYSEAGEMPSMLARNVLWRFRVAGRPERGRLARLSLGPLTADSLVRMTRECEFRGARKAAVIVS